MTRPAAIMGNGASKRPCASAEAAEDDLDTTEHHRWNISDAIGPPPERRRWTSDDFVAGADQNNGNGDRDVNVNNNEEEQENEDGEVPRVISYPRLPDADGASANSSAAEGTAINWGYHPARANHRQASTVSVLTTDGEREPLLGNRRGRRSILKTSLYSSGTSQRSETSGPSSGAVASDDAAPATAAMEERTSWKMGACLHEGEGGSLRGNGSLRSVRSAFSNASTRRRSSSLVAPPDDASLPPGTLLLGSSKMIASIRHKELHDEMGSLSMRSRVISWGERDEGSEDGSAAVPIDQQGNGTARTLQEIEAEYLAKTQTTFYNDAITFAEGTIPQSIVIGLCIGCVCGLVAYVYYSVLDYLLEVIWKDLPERYIVDRWPESMHWLWIPLVTFSLSICCGLSIYYLGEPGDLAYTIQCVHEKGYKGTHHIIPMTVSSMFTILAGGSLGPEAPLVAVCAATAGFVSRKIFKQRNRNVVRKHTFMGMSGALSAFFGVPLGGSIFALEVASRFGVEYFEHLVEAIFAGEVCMTVFRSIAGLPLGAIWKISPTPLIETEPYQIVLGGAIGLLGAGVSFVWANFHWRLMDAFRVMGLLDDENYFAVRRCLVGAVGIVIIGVLVPHTLFWGEFEIQAIATRSSSSELPHVWPTSGLIGFEMDSCVNCLVVGFCKLMAISFTVAGGFRGGYIFPFFAAGAAFGRAMCFVFPEISPSIATLCFAAGINVAITRTSVATSLILACLSGEQFALPVVLAASIASLFATAYVPFIKSQITRSDIDFSLYYRRSLQPRLQDSLRSTDGTQQLSSLDEDTNK